MGRLCKVVIENLSRSFECGEENILDAALRAGVAVPYNCRGGACGTCKAQVLEGSVEQGWVMGFAISDAEVAEGKCLVCSSKPRTERLRLRMLNERPTPTAGVITPREYATEVVAVDELTHTARCVTVRISDPLFSFKGGMYMELLLEGIDPPRPYSIVTLPNHAGNAPAGLISFLVGRHEYGLCSRRLHEELYPGYTLRVRGPYGTFRLADDASGKVLLVAGGTGLAPLMSIASQALGEGYSSPIELLFSVRTAQDVFFTDELQRLADRYPHFSYTVFITRVADSGTLASNGCCGRGNEYLETVPELARSARILIAGSPGFVNACAAAALQSGAAADAVVIEAYAPASQLPRTSL
jgi:CDP-4-dehydro-6-deoxyglucose reductase